MKRIEDRRLRVIVLAAVLLGAPGCLVLTVNPSHDRDDLVWEPGLVGTWIDGDDNASMTIEASEWQSYKIDYAHPIEKGQLTGYLTTIGKERYLDVMPARGQDHGAFLLPVHATLRLKLEGDRLELTALSYDWFFDRLKKKAAIPGLTAVLDEKENALIVSPTAALRAWIAKQPAGARTFGASAVFTRKPGA
ncbi:hypothetical protein BH24ACI5_BH24ACI5_14720 [soil metagenome]